MVFFLILTLRLSFQQNIYVFYKNSCMFVDKKQ